MKMISEEIKSQYRAAFDKLSQETGHFSFVQRNHPSYQELLKMGSIIIPCILEDIEKDNPGIWNGFSLIHESIENEHLSAFNIPEKHLGRLGLLKEDFLQWGRDNGYIDKGV